MKPPYLLLALSIALAPLATWAQSAPSIQIASPTSGAQLAPGGRLDITVSVTPDSHFQGIQIIAQSIGATPVLTQPPFTASFTIPTDAVGIRSINAVGITGSEAGVFATPVSIDIEPSVAGKSVVGLTAIASIDFTYVGQQINVNGVDALFSDGMTLAVEKSPAVTYQSQDPSIAAVDAKGWVTSVGAGTTNLVIGYGSASTTVSVSVPSSMRGDLNEHGLVDLDDLAVIQAALNLPAVRDPATGRDVDARDLNGDGVINVQDTRVLTTLCTYPRCASHK